MNQAKFEWYLLSFLLLIVAVVFWQVYGYMTEAGMASGGPLNNAAAYPKALAILLVIFTVVRAVTKLIQPAQEGRVGLSVGVSAIGKPVLLLLLFGLYLAGLKSLGYHLVTPIFLVAMLFMVGERKLVPVLSFALLSSFFVAFVFEVLLNIVLPGGVFRLNIPW